MLLGGYILPTPKVSIPRFELSKNFIMFEYCKDFPNPLPLQ